MNIPKIHNYLKNCSAKNLKRGEMVYQAGDTPQYLYMIQSGIVGLFHNQESGHETFLRIFSDGDIFGHRTFLAKESYHASSIVLSPSKICMLAISEMESIIEKEPDILRDFSSLLAKELGEAEKRMSLMATQSVTKRVCETLVYLKLRYPEHKWTRKEIAEFAATTFETVARVMGQLTQNNIIEKVGRDFLIKDLEKLISFS